MKRYALFASYSYYPFGGFEDFQASSNSVAYLKRKAKPISDKRTTPGYDSWHIADRQSEKIIATSG